MMTDGRVVVTGIGVSLPIGLSLDEAIDRALGGESGIAALRRFDPAGHACTAAAEVPPFELAASLRIPKNEKFMSRAVGCGVRAAATALVSSGLNPAAADPYRFGIYTGSGQTGLQPSEFFAALDLAEAGDEAATYRNLGGRASRLVDRYWSLRTLANAGLGLLAAEWSVRGACNNFVQGETASAQAIAAAYFDIAEGRSDAVLAGGYDSLLTVSDYLAYEREGLLSSASPERAYRPFDRERDGIALGEGAAFLLLEREDAARERGATILARVVGAGFAQEVAGDLAGDVPSTAAGRAIHEAIGERAPDLLVAHGIGTRAGDRAEAAALARLGVTVPVTAFKGLTGYLGAATAAAELSIAILAARRRMVPPVARLATPDADCPLDLVAGRARPVDAPEPLVLATCRSWSGQYAALAAHALVA